MTVVRTVTGLQMVLLPGIIGMLTACTFANIVNDGRSSSVPNPDADRIWTIAVYMSGDNDLEADAIADFDEMEAVDLSGTNVSVVVLFDRTPGFDSSNGNWTDTRLYEITHDPDDSASQFASTRLSSTELGLSEDTETELNMASDETLARFLRFVGSEYPAEHTALVLWGYSSGYSGVAVDDTSGGQILSTPSVGTALGEEPVDVVAIDSRFGAQIEIAYEIEDGADLLVASQESPGSAGWDYDLFLSSLIESDLSIEAFSESAISSYSSVYSTTAGATISSVNLAAIDNLNTSLNAFSVAVHAAIADGTTRDAFVQGVFDNAEDFVEVPGDLYIDLWDLADYVESDHAFAEAEATALKTSVSEAVRAEWHSDIGNTGAHGISVLYVPVDANGLPVTHADNYFRTRSVSDPLSFVGQSDWVPNDTDESGLLYRLWYEVF